MAVSDERGATCYGRGSFIPGSRLPSSRTSPSRGCQLRAIYPQRRGCNHHRSSVSLFLFSAFLCTKLLRDCFLLETLLGSFWAGVDDGGPPFVPWVKVILGYTRSVQRLSSLHCASLRHCFVSHADLVFVRRCNNTRIFTEETEQFFSELFRRTLVSSNER